MKIVEANKFHTPVIIEMLKKYRSATPVSMFANCDDEEYITKLLTHIYMGKGIAFLAYKDEQPIGMILGIIDQSIWDTEIRILKELAYWVNTESRGSSAGYRLLTKYNERARELRDEGRISAWTISKMTNSPDLDYGKFGYRKVEETWSMS